MLRNNKIQGACDQEVFMNANLWRVCIFQCTKNTCLLNFISYLISTKVKQIRIKQIQVFIIKDSKQFVNFFINDVELISR